MKEFLNIILENERRNNTSVKKKHEEDPRNQTEPLMIQ